MPAKSKAQLKYMRMCAHNPEKAKGECPSKEVAREFSHGPKGKKLPHRVKKKKK